MVAVWAAFGLLAVSFTAGPVMMRGRETALRSVQIGLTAAAMLLHGAVLFGPGRAALFLAVPAALGAGAEAAGIRKGWIFGRYRYSDRVGPKAFGFLPLFAPALWALLSYLAFFAARAVLPEGRAGGLLAVPTAAFLLTAVDAVAEPVAVAEGRWTWVNPGPYHGIPLSNFAGWFAVSCAVFLALSLAGFGRPFPSGPPASFVRLPALGYVLFLGVCVRLCLKRAFWTAAGVGLAVMVLVLAHLG